MSRFLRAIRFVAVAALIALGLPPTAAAPAPPDQPAPTVSQQVATYLVMDVSGSMDGERIKAAKIAANGFIDAVAPGQLFGLYSYPANGTAGSGGCSVGKWVIPTAPINPADAKKKVQTLTANGDTPTGPALEAVLASVKASGITDGQVVLVSDGEANCGDTDICSFADDMQAAGIDLVIHTVSLDNTATGNEQLKCLAEATGGSSANVVDVDGLIDAVKAKSNYVADLEVEVRPALLNATGTSYYAASHIDVTVHTSGTVTIPNARLVATFMPSSVGNEIRITQPVVWLGNLVPGSTVKHTFTLFPQVKINETIGWVVQLQTPYGPLALDRGTTELFPSNGGETSGEIFSGAKNVVIMGDSYSSGEGGGDYAGGGVAGCHRSPHTYGAQLFPGITNLACSGATSEKLREPQGQFVLVASQLQQLQKLIAQGKAPDLVLLTLGGNDAGFGSVVADCVLPWSCKDSILQPNMSIIGNNLVERYGELNSVVNSAQAKKARGGKTAQIVVLPYVDALPVGASSTEDHCFALIDAEEALLLRTYLQRLNAMVQDSVNKARADGAPIHFAAQVEGALQPDHGLCDDEPWMNTIPGGVVDVVGGPPDELLALISKDQELLHPTAEGYAAIAGSLSEWSVSAPVLDDTQVKTPLNEIRILGSLALGQFGIGTLNPDGSLAGLNISTPNSPGSNFYDLQCVGKCAGRAGVGCTSIDRQQQMTCAFPEGQRVTIVIRSEPRILGTAVVTNGEVSMENIYVPIGTPPGEHTLEIRGYNEDGAPIMASIDVNIAPEGIGRAQILGIASAAIAMLAGLLFGVTWLLGRRRADSDGAVSDQTETASP